MKGIRIAAAGMAAASLACVPAQARVPAPAGQQAPLRDAAMAKLAHRLFPVLQALAPPPSGGGAVGAMLAARKARIAACAGDAQCVIQAAQWRDDERTALADHAAASAVSSPSDDGVRAQVLRELAGLDNVLAVYGLGARPRYPEIDGPGAEQGIERFLTDRRVALGMAEIAKADPVTRLDPSIGIALALLDANDQTHAAAFEQDLDRLNGPAMIRARKLDWSRWPYTALIVTGVGPEDLLVPLSAAGKLNVRLAAERHAQGLAPFIVVTGSMVHPRGTRAVEALEMRKALIERFGIPEDAIIVEPYARHTTTNLRNVARQFLAMGVPIDRDALIVTNPQQSAYIESEVFTARNNAELGYQPGTVGTRVSPMDLAFRPSRAATRVDPLDPLDP